MGIRITEIENNVAAEASGVWVLLPIGVWVKVRRANNPSAVKLAERLTAPFKARMRSGGTIPIEDQRRINREVFCREVLVDWASAVDEAAQMPTEPLLDAEGEPLPYDPDFAVKLFAQPKHADFYDQAQETTIYRETFLQIEREESAGN